MMWVSGHATAVLWDLDSKICSKQHAASLCSSHLAFSLSILLQSRYYMNITNVGRESKVDDLSRG